MGALERISTKQVLSAIASVHAGRIYDLGMEINERMPMGPPDAFVPFSRAFSATASGATEPQPMEFAAEVVNGSLHTSTHLDALVHIQSEGRIFGGEREDEVRTDRGFKRHGAETIPPILTRGLVLDIAGARGVEALEDGHEISVSEVEAALEGAGTSVREGDAVLVRTGKIRDFWTKPRDFHRAAPGVGTEAAIWLFERGMALLGTDTSGTEPAPISDRSRTLHVAMLVERGVHLVENLNLDLVCGKGLSEGLFVCLPLRFTGATGSWVRPVLVV